MWPRLHASHGLVRDAMAPDLDVWDLAISTALEKARAAFGDVCAVAAARIVECEDGEEEHDVVEIFDDPIKRRRFLASSFTFHVQVLGERVRQQQTENTGGLTSACSRRRPGGS